ncbi:MAG: histidine kinase [Thermoflavifilum sp.]|nr:histidine kinase [Thermoflavifilum sp.]
MGVLNYLFAHNKSQRGKSTMPMFVWILSGWIVWALLCGWILVRYYGLSVQDAFTDSLTSHLLGLSLLFIMVRVLYFFYPKSNNFWVICGTICIVSWLFVFIDEAILPFLLHMHTWDIWLHNTEPVRFGFMFILSLGASLLSMFHAKHVDEQSHHMRMEEIQKLARDAELYKLEQQLQPHFLFNCLNSVYALIGKDPMKAREMVIQLADFLRGTLRKEQRPLLSLAEELKQIELYLQIEKTRFGQRLQTVLDIGDAALSCELPALLLQPLLENAIKFGLYGHSHEAEIRITARKTLHQLQITITNPFDENLLDTSGTGFGLKSVARRLYLIYGMHNLLQTEINDHVFQVTCFIPQKI